MGRLRYSASVFIAILFSFARLQAAVPELINFQGRLLDAHGTAVTSNKSLIFKFFTAETGGTAVYTETQPVTPDSNGIYNVFIGNVSSLSGVDFNTDLWLEVAVEGETLTPRYRMTSSPYAFRAAVADAVAWSNITGMPADFSDGVDNTVGGLNADSVGSFQIIDSTITTNDVLDGTLINADVSPSAAIALAKLEKDPSVIGSINVSTNPVDWSQLKNVPAAFADGIDNTGGTVDFSSITAQGNTFNGNNQLVQLNGSGALPVLNGANLITLTAANISGGQLGAGVIASSIAVNAVQDAAIVAVSASKISGTLSNLSLDYSSVTAQGNAFNGNSQLVQLNGSGALPTLSGANLTSLTAANISAGNLGAGVVASSIAVNAVQDVSIVAVSASKIAGTLSNTSLDFSSVTAQGNAFNGNSQLLQLNGSGALPTLSGANLTSLTAANISAGNLGASVVASSIAADAVLDASIVTVSSSKLTGIIDNALIDSSSVTKQGNSFNSANQLVKLDGSGRLVFNGGTPIAKHLSATGSLNFGATAASACDSLTMTVTGAADGDSVALGIPNSLAGADANQTFYAYVSASDTVTVKRCNLGGLLALSNPAATTVRVDVWQH